MWNTATHRTGRIAFVLALALCSMAALADTPAAIDSPQVFSGPITAVSSSSLTVQGVEVSLQTSTIILGLDISGAVVTLTPASLLVNDTVTVFAADEGATVSANLILAGLGFHLKGQVTTLTTGTSGPTQVTLDGIFAVNVGQAVWLAGGDHRPHQDGGTVQVGSELELWGISSNGIFTAAFGRLESGGGQGGGETEMDNGFILSLTTDTQNNLIGFTMWSRASIATIDLGPSTQISGKGSDTSALKAGVHVQVWGTKQADGSVLAATIQIKGGMRH
jgi:hypothetical protein